MDKLSLLKSVFIFKGLEDSLLNKFKQAVKEAKFKSGSIIFKEGDSSDSFYIVHSGDVMIYKELGPGKEKVLTFLKSSGIFGEMAFFSDRPRTANAKAASDTLLYSISKNNFLKIVSEQPEEGMKILSKLLEVVMERLEQTSRELATVYQAGKIISSGRSLKEIAQKVQEEINLAIPEIENYAMYFYNEFNREFEPLACSLKLNEIPANDPLVCLIAGKPKGLISEETGKNPTGTGIFKGSKSFLVVPIIKINDLLGFIMLTNTKKANVFKNSHALLILSVAGQLAEAVENIRYQQEERDRKRLKESKQGY
jgi:CRP/FNR family transcriptional regulator